MRDLEKRSKKNNFIIVVLIIALALLSIGSLFIGPSKIAPNELFSKEFISIAILRLSRIILAFIAGAALSVVGAALQAILRNPLSDPYILGVSSGGGFGAAISIYFGISISIFGIETLPIFAFLGALLSIFMVYNISNIGGRRPIQTLILSGVIVGILFSSLLMLFVFSSSKEEIHNILWWLLGSLQVFNLRLLSIVAAINIAGIFIIWFYTKELNAILMGEEDAEHMGINVEKIKKIVLIVSSLMVGSIVSISGIIGFVGLIIPHMMRLIVGPDHKVLIPASALFGSIFLISCDTLSRVIIAPSEMPVGIITSLVGAPYFIVLLRKKQKNYFS